MASTASQSRDDDAGVRSEVSKLVALGAMPSATQDPPDETVKVLVEALDALAANPMPLTADEAIALLDLFPRDEIGLYSIEWTLLHAIESAPYTPELLAEFDERSPMVKLLRERAERRGFL